MLVSFRRQMLAYSRPLSLGIASAVLLINLAVILYGVFMRYLVGGAPIWTDELARFLIIGTVMLVAGAVWVEGGHMRVALIERLLPRPLARLLTIYQWLLTLALALGGAWVSYHYGLSITAMTTSGLGISRTVPVMSLPLGFALLAWHILLYGPAPLPVPTEEEGT